MKRYNFVLTNVKYIDVVSDKIVEGKDIFVKDGIIEFIGEKDKSSYKEIDCKGTFLIPGLINLHVHLFSSGKPSNTLNAKGNSQAKLLNFIKTPLGDKVVNAIVKHNLVVTINSGTTTVRTMGDFQFSDVKQRDLINQNKYMGPRVLACGPAITCIGGHADGSISKHATTKEEYENLVMDNYNHKVDLIKIMITGGVMDAKKRGEPGQLRMSLENTKWVCDKAHSLGYKVAAHTESTEGVLVALKGGVDTVEHSAKLTDEEVKLFKELSKTVTTTLSPAVPYALLDASISHCSEEQTYNASIVSDGIIESSKICQKEGIVDGLGTDASCPYAFQYGMWRELAYFKKYVGVTNEYALKTATLINAKIINMDSKIGSIETGKCADLVLFDKNPYEDLHNLSTPKMVIKDGFVIKHPHNKKNTKFEQILDTLTN